MIQLPGKSNGAKSDEQVEFLDFFPTLCVLAHVPVPGRNFVPLLTSPKQSFRI